MIIMKSHPKPVQMLPPAALINIMLLLAAAGGGVTASPATVKAAYWPSWATNLSPSAINTQLFTHIYYAFLVPNNETYTFQVDDKEALLLKNFTATLHRQTPPAKTLFSIGGGDSSPDLFAAIASCPSSRAAFINSSISTARTHGFDGMDLDWEFPRNPKEMKNFAVLLKEWRAAIRKEAKAAATAGPLLLTAAVYFSNEFFLSDVRRSYPTAAIKNYMDWVSPMCYDYHGSWETSETGAHAALYDPKSNISTSYGLGSWLKAGVPAKKLVMGLPLYGRTWRLQTPKSTYIGAPAVGVGPGVQGTMTYFQVEKFNEENKATVAYNETYVAAYSYAGTSWIGYDSVRSTRTKVKFAKDLGLLGYFFWAVNGDTPQWKISEQASQAWN